MTPPEPTSDAAAAAKAVADAAELEAAGGAEEPTAAQKREAAQQSARSEPRFPLERILGPEGRDIVMSAYDNAPPAHAASAGVLAGAFFEFENPEEGGFTRADVRRAIGEYLERTDTPQEV